ncbi:ATP synthase F0 subunit B [bacterium]|jgi:F0F1-type ATP synthase membrane subunit b/b'|nr:ATP synthase F0 subunit B [bacterium]
MDGLDQLGISLDSILIYFVNYGVLLAVLSYLLYKPINNFTTKRRETIKGQLEQASDIKKEFEQELENLKTEKLAAEKQLQSELKSMKEYVSDKKKELLEEIDAKRSQMLVKAQQEIDEAKANMIKEVEKDLLKKMSKIILEILNNKVPAEVITESVSEAWSEYK